MDSYSAFADNQMEGKQIQFTELYDELDNNGITNILIVGMISSSFLYSNVINSLLIYIYGAYII